MAAPHGIEGPLTSRVAPALALAWALLPASAQAQATRAHPTDVQARVGTELTLDLPRRWRASVQYQVRWVDDISRYRGSYLSTEVERGVQGPFTLLANYRLALVDRGTYHRFGLGAEASGKVGKTKLSFRPQLQLQRQHFGDDDEFGSDDDAYLRTRLWVKHPLSGRVSVMGGVEPYFKFGADYPVDNWRNTLGLAVQVAKNARVDAFYIYRPDYSKSYNRTFHIVGMELEWEVKVRRRRPPLDLPPPP